MSYNQQTMEYVRNCKHCNAIITTPLEVGDKLYMFCSARCRQIWDNECEYRIQPKRKRAWEDGYSN